MTMHAISTLHASRIQLSILFLNAAAVLERADTGLGNDFHDLNSRSLRALRTTLRIAPTFMRGWFALGLHYRARQRPVTAAWLFKRALSLQFDPLVRAPELVGRMSYQ